MALFSNNYGNSVHYLLILINHSFSVRNTVQIESPKNELSHSPCEPLNMSINLKK